jgi:UDP-perosamine 4-acetyltransferase
MSLGIIVIGAGGHAKVCIENLLSSGLQVDYCIASEGTLEYCLNAPVLIGDHNLKRLRQSGYEKCFVAIGNNKLRAKLAVEAEVLGFMFVNAISSCAHISPSAKIGRGVAIMPGAIINAQAEIGDFAIINTGATVDALAGGVKIGNFSFIGIGTVVIPEIVIGKNVVIGAGSVLVSNVDNDALVMGVPAKIKQAK